MRWFRQKFYRRPSKQHLTSLVLLAGFFAALLPIPFSFSVHAPAKDRSQPFPCQDRPCACRSAEQCRKTCCCFTPQQKMAWAKRRGLNSFDMPQVATKTKSSTVNTSLKCCSLAKASKARTVTGKTSIPSDSDHSTPTRQTLRFKMVIGIAAQRCQGVDQSLSGLPIFLVPPKVELTFTGEPRGERMIPSVERIEAGIIEPPVPPPRLVVA